MYPSDVKLNEYLDQVKSSHIIKGFGFPTFQALTTFTATTEVQPGTKKKVLEITPSYLLSLVQVNDEVLTDDKQKETVGFYNKYLSLLKTKNLSATNNRLVWIRKNCVNNIKYYLNPKDKKKENLIAYTQRESYPTRQVKEHSILSVLKASSNKQAKSEQPNVTPPTSFNCFHCDSHKESTEEERIQSPVDFEPNVLGETNVQWLFPRDT